MRSFFTDKKYLHLGTVILGELILQCHLLKVKLQNSGSRESQIMLPEKPLPFNS